MDPFSKSKPSPATSASSSSVGSSAVSSLNSLSSPPSIIASLVLQNETNISLDNSTAFQYQSAGQFASESIPVGYQTIIECIYILTSILALFFNISAIVLIFSQFRHQRRNKNHITLSHSPSHKVPTNSTTTTVSKGMSSHVKLRSGSSQLRIYLVNLFVNDILIALFTTPFSYPGFMYGWIYPAFLCPVSSFISTCAVSVSIYTLIAIGLERYFAIICPFKKLVPFERHTKWIIALIWIIGISLGFPALIQSRAVPIQDKNRTRIDCRELWEGEIGGKIYTGVLFSATFLVPFVLLTYLYVSIAVKAFRHVIPGNADASRDQIQLRNKIRMVKMLVFLVITFAVCWLPIQTFSLVMWTCDRCRTMAGSQFKLYVYTFLVCQWLSIAHSLLDPIIYCFNSRNFKISEICDELGTIGKLLICCCLGRRQAASSDLTSNASFSETDPHRLSRGSISSSLPSSGRNSVAIHSPSYGCNHRANSTHSKHRSLSALPSSPGLGNSRSSSFGTIRHQSVSLGTPRSPFRTQTVGRSPPTARAEFIKEECEMGNELTVFGDGRTSIHFNCSNHSHITRLQSLPASANHHHHTNGHNNNKSNINNGNTGSNHHVMPLRVHHHQSNHHRLARFSKSDRVDSSRSKRYAFLTLVTRLMRGEPNKKIVITKTENGQTWPDVASI